jgi:hypothetical protein
VQPDVFRYLLQFAYTLRFNPSNVKELQPSSTDSDETLMADPKRAGGTYTTSAVDEKRRKYMVALIDAARKYTLEALPILIAQMFNTRHMNLDTKIKASTIEAVNNVVRK